MKSYKLVGSIITIDYQCPTKLDLLGHNYTKVHWKMTCDSDARQYFLIEQSQKIW